MELGEFVSNTVLQILKAIRSAQSDAEVGALVSPRISGGGDYRDQGLIKTEDGGRAVVLGFDIAVSVGTEDQHGGRGGIKVVAFSLGGEASSSRQSETTSRVRFNLPIELPASRGIARPDEEPRSS